MEEEEEGSAVNGAGLVGGRGVGRCFTGFPKGGTNVLCFIVLQSSNGIAFSLHKNTWWVSILTVNHLGE